MTNGEKIQTILDIDKDCTEVYGKNGMMTFSVPQEWWNAEYKEPTTKSDCAERDGCIHKCIDNPTEDCISRADAIRVASGYCHPSNVAKELAKLPSVTPQGPKWIPVSERLPEPYMFVNATCRSLVDDRENWVVETIYLPIPKEHNPGHYSDWGNIPMLNWGEAEVIAWVERVIPQPYKADRSEEE